MVWEPFILALVLGIIVSAGLYFAYLWPSVEPLEPGEPFAPDDDQAAASSDEPAGRAPATAAMTDDAVSSPR